MVEPEWMPNALRAARTLRATTLGAPRAGHSVYVILLHDPRRHRPWGLYVGQTSRDPDWRFDQHKAGYKASGPVRRFGVRLLPELVAHSIRCDNGNRSISRAPWPKLSGRPGYPGWKAGISGSCRG